MGETGGIIALDAKDHRLLCFGQSGRACGANLEGAGDRSDVKNARPGLVGLPTSIDVFEVGPGLGQQSELACHAARLISNLARPDVNPVQFETHGSTPWNDETERCRRFVLLKG